jgi:hypothetical protein
MNTRRMFAKSVLIAPAEDALKRADNQSELDDAWEDYCASFADETPERDYLVAIYMGRVKDFKDAARAAEMMRA